MGRSRAGRRRHRFGAFLDSPLDRLSDAALAIAAVWIGASALTVLDPFFVHKLVPLPVEIGTADILFWGGLLLLVSSFLVSYIRAKAESLGEGATVGLAPREARIAIYLLGVATWAVTGSIQLFAAAFRSPRSSRRSPSSTHAHRRARSMKIKVEITDDSKKRAPKGGRAPSPDPRRDHRRWQLRELARSGRAYSGTRSRAIRPGIMHVDLGGYHIEIRVRAAFDVDKNKVCKDLGRDLRKAEQHLSLRDVPKSRKGQPRIRTRIGKYLSKSSPRLPARPRTS